MDRLTPARWFPQAFAIISTPIDKPPPSPTQPKVRISVLLTHILAVALVQSTWMGLQAVIPVLARKRFDANDWQTLLLTASPTIFFSLSIFWNDLFGRRPFGRYLILYWVVGCFPLVAMGFSNSYWMLLLAHLVTCIGGAGYHPASGELLKGLYPDRLRGRIYSLVWGASMVFGAVGGLLIGRWMKIDEDAFRYYLPICAGLQLLGIGVLIWLGHTSGVTKTRIIKPNGTGGLARVFEPIAHTKEVLKADPVFARYEGAYMVYGIGWMIGYALLPILVTDKLHLDYEQIAQSTQFAYLIALVAMMFPAGLLMDRLGAARSTALSFGMLTLYPLGLIWAMNVQELTIVSVVYGVAHAGASVGWMIGPVALAPSPDKVPQYVAIHATFVGIRGKLFQGLGVLLYSLTGSFVFPLLIAAAAYLWSAKMMWVLEKDIQARASKKV